MADAIAGVPAQTHLRQSAVVYAAVANPGGMPVPVPVVIGQSATNGSTSAQTSVTQGTGPAVMEAKPAVVASAAVAQAPAGTAQTSGQPAQADVVAPAVEVELQAQAESLESAQVQEVEHKQVVMGADSGVAVGRDGKPGTARIVDQPALHSTEVTEVAKSSAASPWSLSSSSAARLSSWPG